MLCRRATDIYLSVMVLLFPLFTGWDGYVMLMEKKFFFFAGCTVLWLLALAAIALPGGIKTRPGWTDGLILAGMAAFAVSTILSEYPRFLSVETGRCDGLVTYLLYGGILMGVSRYGAPEKRLLYLAALGYGGCCALASLQLMGYNPLGFYPEGANYYAPIVRELGDFLGTVGNIGALSAYHCLMIPLMLSEVILGRSKTKWALLPVAIVGLACAVGAGVASGMVALCGTCGVALCAAAAYRWGRGKYSAGRILLCAAVLLLLLGGAAALLLYLVPFRSGTLYELHMVLHGTVDDSFGSKRILIWKECWEVFCDHLLLGVGPDCLSQYLDIRFERYSEVWQELVIAYVDNAHNEYLHMLCSFGLLGSAVPAALLGYAGYRACSGGARTAVRFLPAALCYMIQAFFNIGLCIVTPLFLILWGLLLGSGRNRIR